MAVHPIILPRGRVRQENCEFGASLDYTARPFLKMKKQKKKKTKNPTICVKDSLLVHHHTQVTIMIYSHKDNQNRKHFKMI
jgi:hypothetical protein